MFKILDGRDELFQWDINRQIIVSDASIDAVHFCNRTDVSALVVEVKEKNGLRVADVPNILLQESWDINVYGYCGGHYTKQAAKIKVNPRCKPESYVYTETEVLNYNTVMEKIDRVENNIGEVVNDYLIKNPVVVDLSNYYTKYVTHSYFRSIDKFAFLYNTASITGNIIFAIAIHTGHFGSFSTDKGTTGLAATISYPGNNTLYFLWII